MSDPVPPVSDRSLSGALARFVDSSLLLLQSRAELGAIEFGEERDRLLRSAALLLAATLAFMFAVLGVAGFIVAYYGDTHRLEAIAVVTIAFALIGGGLWWWDASARRNRPPAFAATRAEFERDREWLARSVRPDEPAA